MLHMIWHLFHLDIYPLGTTNILVYQYHCQIFQGHTCHKMRFLFYLLFLQDYIQGIALNLYLLRLGTILMGNSYNQYQIYQHL